LWITTSTWSVFWNDMALRSKVASSKPHFGDASFQISLAKSCVFFSYPARPRSVAK
jgi:hypothetical protein